MDLSELKNLDSILNVKQVRPNSAYATMTAIQNAQNKDNKVIKSKIALQPTENTQLQNSSNSASECDKPILRRERTFDLEQSSILNKVEKCSNCLLSATTKKQRIYRRRYQIDNFKLMNLVAGGVVLFGRSKIRTQFLPSVSVR